jgi:hypothetical protein
LAWSGFAGALEVSPVVVEFCLEVEVEVEVEEDMTFGLLLGWGISFVDNFSEES